MVEMPDDPSNPDPGARTAVDHVAAAREATRWYLEQGATLYRASTPQQARPTSTISNGSHGSGGTSSTEMFNTHGTGRTLTPISNIEAEASS